MVMLLLVSLRPFVSSLLSVDEHAPNSGVRVGRVPWAAAAAQTSTRKTSDALTFAFALHRNLGVSESSLMFTVSE